MTDLISLWLNDLARAAWLWSLWLDDASVAFAREGWGL